MNQMQELYDDQTALLEQIVQDEGQSMQSFNMMAESCFPVVRGVGGISDDMLRCADLQMGAYHGPYGASASSFELQRGSGLHAAMDTGTVHLCRSSCEWAACNRCPWPARCVRRCRRLPRHRGWCDCLNSHGDNGNWRGSNVPHPSDGNRPPDVAKAPLPKPPPQVFRASTPHDAQTVIEYF